MQRKRLITAIVILTILLIGLIGCCVVLESKQSREPAPTTEPTQFTIAEPTEETELPETEHEESPSTNPTTGKLDMNSPTSTNPPATESPATQPPETEPETGDPEQGDGSAIPEINEDNLGEWT